jgi:hypothetical protein
MTHNHVPSFASFTRIIETTACLTCQATCGVPRRNIPPPSLDRERSDGILAVAGEEREGNSERRTAMAKNGCTPRAAVRAMWICFALACLLLYSFLVAPKPLIVIQHPAFLLAIPLDIAAYIMAIICLTRGRPVHGVPALLGSTLVSIIIATIVMVNVFVLRR